MAVDGVITDVERLFALDVVGGGGGKSVSCSSSCCVSFDVLLFSLF